MPDADGGAANLAGSFPWDAPPATMHRDPDGTWTVDGVPGVPAAVLARLDVDGGEDFRLATFGRVLAVKQHDFGPPAGVCLTIICQKYAAVYLPAQANPVDRVQGVLLAVLPAVLGGA